MSEDHVLYPAEVAVALAQSTLAMLLSKGVLTNADLHRAAAILDENAQEPWQPETARVIRRLADL